MRSFLIIWTLITLTATSWGMASGSADTTRSYLWGLIQLRPETKITYEPGHWRDRLFYRREFHEPIHFIPLELRYGVGFYGGGGRSGLKMPSQWMQYAEGVSKFDGGKFTERIGHQLELDLLKSNLSEYLLQTSWLDMHTGLNLRYSSLFAPPNLPTSIWGDTNPAWDPGAKKFAPRLLELSLSQSWNLQWFEWWFLNFRYTYGLATAKFYLTGKDQYDATPKGWGPAVSYSAGLRFILDTREANRFTIGLDFKHSYTKINHLSDPGDVTPITQFHLPDYAVVLTISVFYGGKLTVGDLGKVYYYRRDFVTAKEKFEEFITLYPNHANRYRAERYIANCNQKIPFQLYDEGVQFENRKLTAKAIDKYLQAQATADTALARLINDRLNHIANLMMEQAEQLLETNQPEEALETVLKVSSFSPEISPEISRFRAQVLLKKGQTALKYKFFDKALTYFNQALDLDPNLRFQVGTLRYQTASQLVRQANEIQNPEDLQLAIQSLEQARQLIGGLGSENERILQELKAKLATLESLRLQEKIAGRMEAVRQRRASVKRQLQIGMTIPQVQEILGEPENVVHKPDLNGQDAQLWFYTLPNEKQLQLSFLNFLLFKVEEH